MCVCVCVCVCVCGCEDPHGISALQTQPLVQHQQPGSTDEGAPSPQSVCVCVCDLRQQNSQRALQCRCLEVCCLGWLNSYTVDHVCLCEVCYRACQERMNV